MLYNVFRKISKAIFQFLGIFDNNYRIRFADFAIIKKIVIIQLLNIKNFNY